MKIAFVGLGNMATAMARNVVAAGHEVSVWNRSPESLEADHIGRGNGFVSAPVLGRPEVAAEGRLFVLAAGAQAALKKCRPLFAVVGQHEFNLGERASAAKTAKLAVNFMIFSQVNALSDAMKLCEKSGLKKADFYDVLINTMFNNFICREYGAKIVKSNFSADAASFTMVLKDLALVEAASSQAGSPMPILTVLPESLGAAMQQHGPDADWLMVSQ